MDVFEAVAEPSRRALLDALTEASAQRANSSPRCPG